MTDAEALARAQSIWGPKVIVKHEVSLGYLTCEHYLALRFRDDDSCEQIAISSHYDGDTEPASWEAMFANAEAR